MNGECGLDYNRNFSDPETQCFVFHKQVKLGCRIKKLLVIHERGAQNDVEILRHYRNKLPPVLIHSFIVNADEAKMYIDEGFYLGITSYLCKDKSDSGLRQVFEIGNVPLDKILVQTDAPFMYPNNRASKLPEHD